MIAATVFNGTFTPVFYAVFQGLGERLGRRKHKEASEPGEPGKPSPAGEH